MDIIKRLKLLDSTKKKANIGSAAKIILVYGFLRLLKYTQYLIVKMLGTFVMFKFNGAPTASAIKKYSHTVLFCLLATTSVAHAQVEDATAAADPSRIGQELMDTDTLPILSPKINVKSTAAQKAPANAENITFVLDTLQIDGVGAYEAEDLDPLYRAKLGETVSLADIYTIANNMTTKYRNDGYILTQVVVPPQTIENGLVKLRVVEGFVDQISIDGDVSESEADLIHRYADNLRADNILDAKSLERYLLLINDLAGVTARSVLSPSPTTPGASDLTIIVERDAYEAEIGFNNHGSRFLGPYQASYNGALNSMLGHNERIGTQFVIAGDKERTDELLFGAISYEQPLSRFGNVLRLLASVTNTEPGSTLDAFDVKGHSKFFSATVEHPFIRSRSLNFSGRGSFDMRNVTSKNDLEPNNREDRIRAVRLGTTVQFMDTLFGVGVNAVDFEFSQGIDVFGASERGDANLTRARGNPHFTKAELKMQRLQRVYNSLNLLMMTQGQWAATPLLSSEEFGVGGTTIGRGYDSSEIVGEDGISGKVELQWNEPTKVKYINDYQVYGFYDIGRVWNQDATTSAGKRESVASTGLGIRADITDKTKAGVGVAFPLTRNRDVTDDRDPRYYFHITHEF